MKSKLSDKLEAYESFAYSGGFGVDWLADIGENFKFYILECENNNIQPTIEGFVQRIDTMAKKSLENSFEVQVTDHKRTKK